MTIKALVGWVAMSQDGSRSSPGSNCESLLVVKAQVESVVVKRVATMVVARQVLRVVATQVASQVLAAVLPISAARMVP